MSLRIINGQNKISHKHFEDLEPRDIFIFDRLTYMRAVTPIGEQESHHNAVCLSSGELSRIHEKEICELRLDATLLFDDAVE